MIVLGITRADGSYVGAPGFGTEVRAGDTLLLYGRSGRMEELDTRKKGPEGDALHEQATRDHRDD